MEKENRDFKGVWISKEIWLDENLNALEKVVLAEIDSLDNGERGCYASNLYFANFCHCSERQISRCVSHLTELGYIEAKSFDGRLRVLRSRLDKMSRQTRQNVQADTTNCPPINIDTKPDNSLYISSEEKQTNEGGTEIVRVVQNLENEEETKLTLEDMAEEITNIWNSKKLINAPIDEIRPFTLRWDRLDILIKTYGWEKVKQVFEDIDNNKAFGGWKPKFNWFVEQNNFQEVAEGSYKEAWNNNNTKNGKQYLV